MLLKILGYGDQLLRRQAKEIEEFDNYLSELISNMISTMKVADGIGLAAPQIGKSIMLFIIDWSRFKEEGGDIKAYINPEITLKTGEFITGQEGCLSVPEVWADVQRQEEIHIRYQDVEQETIEEDLRGLSARVFQHEFDHLSGILFIDRVPQESRSDFKDKLQAILNGDIKTFDGKITADEAVSK